MPPTDREFGRLEEKVDGLDRKFDRLERKVDGLVSNRDEAKGAFQFGGFLKGIAGFILAAIGYMAGSGKTP